MTDLCWPELGGHGVVVSDGGLEGVVDGEDHLLHLHLLVHVHGAGGTVWQHEETAAARPVLLRTPPQPHRCPNKTARKLSEKGPRKPF